VFEFEVGIWEGWDWFAGGAFVEFLLGRVEVLLGRSLVGTMTWVKFILKVWRDSLVL
jgi:hypothetical protein